MNQATTVLHHIRKYGTINVIEALNLYKIMRLAPRADDINKGKGVEIAVIDSKMITVPSGKRVAEYFEATYNSKTELIKECEKIRDDYPPNHPEINKINLQISKLRS